ERQPLFFQVVDLSSLFQSIAIQQFCRLSVHPARFHKKAALSSKAASLPPSSPHGALHTPGGALRVLLRCREGAMQPGRDYQEAKHAPLSGGCGWNGISWK